MLRTLLRKKFLDVVGQFSTPTRNVHLLNCHFSGALAGDNEVFSSFLSSLDDMGTLIDFDVAVKYVTSNFFEHQKPMIALSFDDGFLDCYESIFPILRERNIKAAFFINAQVIEGVSEDIDNYKKIVDFRGRRFMTWRMLKSMQEDGQIIGSHTYSHARLSGLDFDSFRVEVDLNHDILTSRLVHSPTFFAWPYGGFFDITDWQINYLRTRYPFIFSSYAYKFYFSQGGAVINRRHVEPYWPKNHIKYFLSHEKKINFN